MRRLRTPTGVNGIQSEIASPNRTPYHRGGLIALEGVKQRQCSIQPVEGATKWIKRLQFGQKVVVGFGLTCTAPQPTNTYQGPPLPPERTPLPTHFLSCFLQKKKACDLSPSHFQRLSLPFSPSLHFFLIPPDIPAKGEILKYLRSQPNSSQGRNMGLGSLCVWYCQSDKIFIQQKTELAVAQGDGPFS